MIKRITIEEYLSAYQDIPLIDVRTPSEFRNGHIPGAFNIPLFSDEERAHVGTVYKQQSQEKAMALGYEYVNPKLNYFVEEALKLAGENKVVVHCWRGGMRSKAFAEHIHENGIGEVCVIEGGYKAFRQYALESFDSPGQLYILGGFTGSGKTRILRHLEQLEQQVIDLEGLANHKGSAFGGIGQEDQPSTEHFANLIFWKWKDMDLTRPVWFEDESSNIGRINIPEILFSRMRISRLIFLKIPREKRAELLVEEYALCEKERLAAAIERISKKLGGLRAAEALTLLYEGNYYETALITLDYYDKYYLKGLNKREPSNVVVIESEEIDSKINAGRLIDFIKKHE